MDLQHLMEHRGELISFMEEKGYSTRYIQNLNLEINRILKKAGDNKWESYADIYHDYLLLPYSDKHLKSKRTILGVLEQFDVYGIFPGGKQHHSLIKSDCYHLLNPEFKELIDFYCTHERNRGKKESTIYGESRNAASFFASMQKRGAECFDKISESDVLPFFISEDNTVLRGHACKAKMATVLKVGIMWKEDACRRILNYLPPLRQSRKNIQYLTDEEIKAVRRVLDEGNISLRDKAVILLLLFTGLRRSDIAGLTLESIDWQAERIFIIQKKTAMPLELPLSAVVGNAIYDYIAEERPDTGDAYLFLSEIFPHSPIGGNGIASIVGRVFQAAGIRQNAGDRKGSHLFRHHLASTMLENGVPQPVISRTLGHTAPESLEPYLRTDFAHLKECALSIGQFPLSKEVLSV